MLRKIIYGIGRIIPSQENDLTLTFGTEADRVQFLSWLHQDVHPIDSDPLTQSMGEMAMAAAANYPCCTSPAGTPHPAHPDLVCPIDGCICAKYRAATIEGQMMLPGVGR